LIQQALHSGHLPWRFGIALTLIKPLSLEFETLLNIVFTNLIFNLL